MLLWLSTSAGFTSHFPALPRAMCAALTAAAITLLCGPWVIRWLARCCPERIATDSARLNQLHQHKSATPSMGGLLILGGSLLAMLACCAPDAPLTWLAVVVLVGFGVLGAADDLRKRRLGRGLSAKAKFAAQLALSLAIASAAYSIHLQDGSAGVLHLPFYGTQWSIGLWYIPLATMILVAASNSVNLTDGLDGLAGGCLLCALAALAGLALVLASPFWSAWFGLPSAPRAAEMVVVASAAIGALLAFLWFNCQPAQVFMGDCGSLPLGALLGLISIACRQELLLVVIGGVFVAETLSVILQVAAFRSCGRRLFRCAPLHHHFQFAGWPESKIVVRFWIAALLCAGIGLFGFVTGASSPSTSISNWRTNAVAPAATLADFSLDGGLQID